MKDPLTFLDLPTDYLAHNVANRDTTTNFKMKK